MIPQSVVTWFSYIYHELGHTPFCLLLKTICRSEQSSLVFIKLLFNLSLTHAQLMDMTGIPETTLYRILADFKSHGLIEVASKQQDRYGLRGGRKVTSWRLVVGL